MVLDLWFMWLLLVALVWEKLSYFRIKELKDVLTQLGLSKQGKKQKASKRQCIRKDGVFHFHLQD
jgi:hypothetical protein